MEIRVILEFIVDFPELLTITDRAVRTNGEKLGGNPNLAFEIGEVDRFPLLVDGAEIARDRKPLRGGFLTDIDDGGHVRFGKLRTKVKSEG